MIEIEQEGNLYHVYKILIDTKERILVGSSLTFEGALAIERMMVVKIPEMNPDLLLLFTILRDTQIPLTAARLAKKLGTYPATIKRRVKTLEKFHFKIISTHVREGKRGFPSLAWRIGNEQ